MSATAVDTAGGAILRRSVRRYNSCVICDEIGAAVAIFTARSGTCC